METEKANNETNDTKALVPSSNQNNIWNLITLGGLIASLVMIFIAVILSGMNVTQVNSNSLCSSSVSYSSCSYFTTTSVEAEAPQCSSTCYNTVSKAATSVALKASISESVLSSIIGDVRSVFNDATGNSTLLSANQGPINTLQPLLCNMTAGTNISYSIFQYLPPSNFERVVTTLKQTNGQNAVCTQLSHSSPAYPYALAGESYQGTVTLYGRSYYAIYKPIFDALTKDMIGNLFVGVPN